MSGGRRPIIGICAAVHPADWTVWRGVDVNLSPRTYSLTVGAAGGMPVVLPPDAESTADPGPLLDAVDGLLLTGGADVDPGLYGERPAAETQVTNRDRDSFEVALAELAIERDLPVLGVCRGMELLNVVRGGSLVQHLAEAELHLHTPGEFADHDVRLEPGSLAARAVGRERVAVRSHHHQGLDDLGDGLAATGWSEPDEAVEAIELPGRRFVLGVLWHPEEDEGSSVVQAFVDAARAEVATA